MPITELAERVRIAIYDHLALTGRMVPHAELARRIDATEHELSAAIDELATARHLVIRDEEVVLAHPFATRSFGFSVMGPSTLWWGGCAWDAFAIPHLVPSSPEVLVATTCPACQAPHAWTVTNQTPPAGAQVAHFLTPMPRVWDDVVHACAHQQIFCSEACIARWLANTQNPRGYVMSLATLWNLAAHWYDGRLASPYERRDPAAAAAYFESVGLDGPFWGLAVKTGSR